MGVIVKGISLECLEHREISSNGQKLDSYIAIHDTTLGKGLGGYRFHSYDDFNNFGFGSREGYALDDVARLAQAMTRKAAVHKLPLGGAKAVTIGNPDRHKNEESLREFGKFVNSLKGIYVTAEDSGTNKEDMKIIAEETPYVVGLDSYNGLMGSGNPGPFTAYGLSRSIEAAVIHYFKIREEDLEEKLSKLTLGVHGVGSVGFPLIFGFPDDKKFDFARNMFTPSIKRFKQIIVADTNPKRIGKVKEKSIELKSYDKIKIVEPYSMPTQQIDIYSPCLTVGGILNKENIYTLYNHRNCKIVVGGTNHQLATEEDGLLMLESGMLYGPDFVVNGGGLINVYQELVNRSNEEHYNMQQAVNKVNGIYCTAKEIFERSSKEAQPTNIIANNIADERIKAKK